MSFSNNFDPENPKPAGYFLGLINALVMEIAPNITEEQKNKLFYLEKSVVAASAHSTRMLQNSSENELAAHREIIAVVKQGAENLDNIIKEYQEIINRKNIYIRQLLREIEVSEMLDDLEKELGLKMQ